MLSRAGRSVLEPPELDPMMVLDRSDAGPPSAEAE